MNHDNPPVALPNGQVFSKAFVMSQARPKQQPSTKKPSAWERLKLHKDRVQELEDTHQNGGNSSGSNGCDKSDKMSSIFEGCYCGGSVNCDLNACVSPGSTMASSMQAHVLEGQKESVSNTGDMNSGEPLSAIEVMMRLSGGANRDAATSVDRRVLAVTSLAGEMRRKEKEDASQYTVHHLEEDQEGEGGSGRMSDSPLPPPPLFFTCPVTGSTFDVSALKAVFIV